MTSMPEKVVVWDGLHLELYQAGGVFYLRYKYETIPNAGIHRLHVKDLKDIIRAAEGALETIYTLEEDRLKAEVERVAEALEEATAKLNEHRAGRRSGD